VTSELQALHKSISYLYVVLSSHPLFLIWLFILTYLLFLIWKNFLSSWFVEFQEIPGHFKVDGTFLLLLTLSLFNESIYLLSAFWIWL